jgi:hypothetical protein
VLKASRPEEEWTLEEECEGRLPNNLRNGFVTFPRDSFRSHVFPLAAGYLPSLQSQLGKHLTAVEASTFLSYREIDS